MRHWILTFALLLVPGCGTFGPGERTLRLNILGNTLEVTSQTYGPTVLGEQPLIVAPETPPIMEPVEPE